MFGRQKREKQMTEIAENIFLEDGEMFFKQYSTITFGHYFKTLKEEVEYIISLGCVLDSYDPEKNLAEFLIRFHLPATFENKIIQEFKIQLQNKIKSSKDYDKLFKQKLKKVKGGINGRNY